MLPDPDVKLKLLSCGSQTFGLLDPPIGSGGSSVVRKGFSLSHPGQPYAVKMVSLACSENRELALKELAVVQQLPAHPNLVRIQKIKVESQNHIYIFMEFCDGGTLFDLANRQSLGEEQIYDLFSQLVQGYKVLFDNKVLHEDLKLQNVLVHQNSYKISDFGLAVLNQGHRYGAKRKGTLSYMPLQKLTKKQYTASVKSDVYSLGVLLYEVICRRHPYVGTKGDAKTWIADFREAKLREDLLGRYSLRFRGLFDMVLKMLAKKEEDRVGFEEIWGFYERWEGLEGYRGTEKGKSKQQQKEEEAAPEKYSVIATSNAEIVSFAPQELELPEIQLAKDAIALNKGLAQLIEVILKSLQSLRLFSPQSQSQSEFESQPECLQLEFLLHLSRCQILKSLPLDLLSSSFPFPTSPFSSPLQSLLDSYQSDCRFVQQELMDFLADTSLPQSSKKQMLAVKNLDNVQDVLNFVRRHVMGMFKTRFVVVRVNCWREIIVLYYLVRLVGEKQGENSKGEGIGVEILEQIQRQGQDQAKVKQVIEEFLRNENVMIDAEQYDEIEKERERQRQRERENSEEFELLE